MRKTLIALIAAFVLIGISGAPALAKNQNNQNGQQNRLNGQSQSYVKREVRVAGSIAQIKGATAPTEIVINTEKIFPGKRKSWNGAYPAANQSVTVKISTKTIILRGLGGKSSMEELSAGDKIVVWGKTAEDGSIIAQLIRDTSLRNLNKVHTGRIESINGANSSFVFKQGKNSATVNVVANTKILVPNITSPTFSDLHVGDKVHVRGVVNRVSKIVTANLVNVLPAATSTLK